MRFTLWEFLFTIEKNKLFSSSKKGFMLTFPVVLIGTVAVLLNSILLPFLSPYFPALLSEVISAFCVSIYNATVGCLSLYLGIAVGYYYAQARGVDNILLRLMSVLTGGISFVLLVGGPSAPNFLSYMGVIGVLPSILVSVISVRVFLALTHLISHTHTESSLGVDDNLKVSMLSILPMFLTVFGAMLIQYIAVTVFHVGDVYETLSSFFQMIFVDGSHGLLTGVLFTCFVNLLWIFGIHGGNVMDPISEAFLVPAITDPNAIVSKSFLDIFAQMGGSGATLCLLLALFIGSRSKTTRGIARSSAPMILFNINELVVFGLPIIFNPIMMIPFVLVPLVSLFIAYFATVIGFIPVVTEVVSWTTPIFFSGYLGTGSIHGILVQLLILICGVLIYLPFVKLLDKFQEERELRILNQLIATFRANETAGIYEPMLTRTDALGQTARTMAHQLRLDVEANEVPLHYQPQMNAIDAIVGGEALMRWSYQGQAIYPPFVIALAQEEGILNQLTLQSTETVCQTIQDISRQTGHTLPISLNMSANQLDDTALVKGIIAIVKQTDTIHFLHLELTEEASLYGFHNIDANIRTLYDNGIVVAIDDFGMGQTSINYLKEHTFEYVKIDGSLVSHVLTNPRCSQIITSIIELGHSLHYQVIAEYVSTLEIKQRLMEMGCYLFQGHYYSPAIEKEAFIQYCQKTLDAMSQETE